MHPPGSTPDEDHIGGVMLNGQLASLESGGSWVQTPVMPNEKKKIDICCISTKHAEL